MSSDNGVTPRTGSATAILERVVTLVGEGHYEEADAAARGMSYLGLVGGIAEPITFREDALAEHWAEVRRRPALLALAALLRQQVSGDISAMDDDLAFAARTLSLKLSDDPVRRVSDLALQALCLLLGSRTDEALHIARRAATLLEDLSRNLGKARKLELSSSACDLAGMFLLLDEFTSAMKLWALVRAKISDPSSPLLVQADVGLACAAEIAGSRVLVRSARYTPTEHEDAPGLWHAIRLAADAWHGLDEFDPRASVALTREATEMLPDPYALGPLVTVHVASLIAVGHPRWAVEFLDAVDAFGLPAPRESALGRMRLLERVVAQAAAGDAASAEATERRLAGDTQLHALALAYRLLWTGRTAEVVAVAAAMPRPIVTSRYEAFVRYVSAAAHARQGMDAEALADLDRIGSISLAGGVRGVALLLPRTDVAALVALADAAGLTQIRRLLPDPEQVALDAVRPIVLKPRERQVLGLAASGLTNAEIAERLYLSPNTVKYHLSSAYRALGASTREQAVALAAQHGQLTDPSRIL